MVISLPWLPSPETTMDGAWAMNPLSGRLAQVLQDVIFLPATTPSADRLHRHPTSRTLSLGAFDDSEDRAIYTGGVLKPTGDLRLQDKQRVRLTVETIDEPD